MISSLYIPRPFLRLPPAEPTDDEIASDSDRDQDQDDDVRHLVISIFGIAHGLAGQQLCGTA